MSFKSLRNERNDGERSTKSFVHHSSKLEEEHVQPMAIDENILVTSKGHQEHSEAVRFDGLYNDLGLYLEIRTSKTKGKGLYSNRSLRKGSYFSAPINLSVLLKDLPSSKPDRMLQYCRQRTCLNTARNAFLLTIPIN